MIKHTFIRGTTWIPVSYREFGSAHFGNTKSGIRRKDVFCKSKMPSKKWTDVSQTQTRTFSDKVIKNPMSALGVTIRSETSWNEKDAILYALGVTASIKDSHGLKFLYENDESFTALPTFAIVPLSEIIFGETSILRKFPEWTIDFTKLLHGEQYLEFLAPMPMQGKGYCEAKITDVLDKTSGAVVLSEIDLFDENDTQIIKSQWTVFIVGDGGFGGPRNSDNTIPLDEPPDAAPDFVIEAPTSVDQAALYRLSGDRNPLHIDQEFAAQGGFDEPILHGLCSYGIVTKCIVNTLCNGDVSKFKAIKTRFAKPVLPGDTLIISVWEKQSRLFFEAKSKRTQELCLAGGYIDLYS